MEKCLVSLDNAKYALAYSSGMAAIASMVNQLVCGDHILCSSDVYGGTYRLLTKVAKQVGILFDFIDFSDAEHIAKNIKPNTKVSKACNRLRTARVYLQGVQGQRLLVREGIGRFIVRTD